MSLTKYKLKLFGTILFLISAFVSALTMTGQVRLVTILTLFFGGFGAGVTLISFVYDRKLKRDQHE